MFEAVEGEEAVGGGVNSDDDEFEGVSSQVYCGNLGMFWVEDE